MEQTDLIQKYYNFLKKADHTFPVPLSQKQDLLSYAHKLQERATICAFWENDEIISMVAGYTDNLEHGLAYIAIAATLECGRGRGLASMMLQEFLNICKDKGVNAVHLYTTPSNKAALHLYQKLGFLPWNPSDEPRPKDTHLILYFKESVI